MNPFPMTFLKFILFSCSTLTFAAISSYSFANDGAYFTKGGVIYPMKESKISMEKEHLSFVVVNNWCTVNIAFEFNNPENTDRKITVGFQAPTAVGDVTEEEQATNQIEEFRVMQDGAILPYTLKIAECEDCQLQDIGQWNPVNQADDGVFVYLFEVNFKPGINKINHSYRFPASNSVMAHEIYNYILTTGSKWAGETIKDLTVDFNLGENSYFYMNDIFGKTANWEIIGTGVVTPKALDKYDDTKDIMVRVLSGFLQIRVNNLKPKSNIEFGVIDSDSFSTTNINDSESSDPGLKYKLSEYNIEKSTTREQLRILRNTIYAQHGLTFASTDLKKHFAQFAWYVPDPNLQQKDIHLTEQEQTFLNLILEREKQLSK